MINPNRVLKRLSSTEKYHELEVLHKDNSKAVVKVSPKQADLIMAMKLLISYKRPLMEVEWNKLVERIEEYGFERYEEGANDESINSIK